MKSSVQDVMTTQVVAVKKTASFKEMILRMQKSRVSALPVADDAGRVIGVVSQADPLNNELSVFTRSDTDIRARALPRPKDGYGVRLASIWSKSP